MESHRDAKSCAWLCSLIPGYLLYRSKFGVAWVALDGSRPARHPEEPRLCGAPDRRGGHRLRGGRHDRRAAALGNRFRDGPIAAPAVRRAGVRGWRDRGHDQAREPERAPPVRAGFGARGLPRDARDAHARRPAARRSVAAHRADRDRLHDARRRRADERGQHHRRLQRTCIGDDDFDFRVDRLCGSQRQRLSRHEHRADDDRRDRRLRTVEFSGAFRSSSATAALTSSVSSWRSCWSF